MTDRVTLQDRAGRPPVHGMSQQIVDHGARRRRAGPGHQGPVDRECRVSQSPAATYVSVSLSENRRPITSPRAAIRLASSAPGLPRDGGSEVVSAAGDPGGGGTPDA